MLKKMDMLIAACFYYSGLVKLARWLTRRAGPRLIIINYHRATGSDLRRQFLYFRRHYRLLHLEEALEELYAPATESKQTCDRRTRMVLTFDDGYKDTYTHAFKIACELGIPLTLFLIPGYIESGELFWWVEGDYLVRHSQVDEVTFDGGIYQLGQQEERTLLVQKIDRHLRYAASVAEREAFLKKMRAVMAVSMNIEPEEEASRPLTWGEIGEMEESQWVSFGAHTVHHPILAYLTDSEELRREIEECRHMLEQRLKHPVRVFAYPVGKPEHIGARALALVRQAGYDWAVTTSTGSNSVYRDPYQLRRIVVDVRRHWLVVAAKTSGVWYFFSPLWRWVHSRGDDEGGW